MDLLERLTAKGPKRMLALDGGGIRGMLSISFLEEIERILRERHGRPDLVLCDYFDLIGGTSTGAIIAAGLSIGMDTAQLRDIYLKLGKEIFRQKKTRIWEALYDEKPFMHALVKYLGDTTLGDPAVKTGLCIVTKRADTNSIWPLINHPQGKFYEDNKDIRLRDAVRASAAAPLFFTPAKVEISASQTAAFVDGGMSMANNPALQLLLTATLKGFPFRWPTGEKKLLLASVGTGDWEWKVDPIKMARGKSWDWLGHLPKMFIQDTRWHNELMLQYLSNTKTPWEVDSESGDLSDDLLTPEPLLTYLRYNVRLESQFLEGLGLAELVPRLPLLRSLSGADAMPDLARIGDIVADLQVKEDHFPKAFDLK